ncbi:MAG TPA: 3-oxoacyl-[acyl-carrier-protein] synthase III C-terminal domain-containing protein [Candidatus Binataceae bacterium]|nr:3-oxoacyl-[acyl-carrier-protein] synthase III C-terminal domain-containing protein [Candidatus Binataceae bacterium]
MDNRPGSPTAYPRIFSSVRALPGNRFEQQTLADALWGEWGGSLQDRRRFERFQRAVGVKNRYLALTIDEYRQLRSFAEANARWREVAIELGKSAIESALSRAQLTPAEVDHLFFTTVTGISTPSIDVALSNSLGMRQDLKRSPLFGLGCVGGAAGMARAADYLRAFPNHVALLLSVELCSLTLQRGDQSTANIIASALFGDGSAAVILGGGARAERGGPAVIASESILFPNSEELMGWEIGEGGFKVVLSPGVPDLVRTRLRSGVDSFLDRYGLRVADVRHWIAHTGGPKVLEGIEAALELPARALERSWRSLETTGNLSSASVLHVLAELLESGEPRAGERGVMIAMGPGFCAELLLLEW